MNEQIAATAAFAALTNITPRRHRWLVERDTPVNTWSDLVSGRIHHRDAEVSEKLLRDWSSQARSIEPVELVGEWRARGIDVITDVSPRWPPPLLGDPEPPMALFGRGPVLGGGPTVAIVGTRRCTSYGRRIAARLGRQLAERGVAVVSGAAAGIDAEAQRAALDAGGDVVAVVGSGIDTVYPASNRRLWNDLADQGRIWSEYPPGTRPRPWRFPARNRIIAALADVVVVVESAAKGGSLHTVDAALERDVEVFSVPGPIDSTASEGTNRLLVQGSPPCTGIDDLLVGLGLCRHEVEPAPAAGTPSPNPIGAVQQQVLDALAGEAASMTELALRTGLSVDDLISTLGQLESRGMVRNSVGWYERVA